MYRIGAVGAPSQDGDYWIFYRDNMGGSQSSVYCFFVPMGILTGIRLEAGGHRVARSGMAASGFPARRRLRGPMSGRREEAFRMAPMITAAAVTKRYATGFLALDAVDLTIERGEIFALLGPNGAGKTTLIGAICGTVSMTSGSATVAGHDIAREFRAARAKIGYVPQEIALDIFATVQATAAFSRSLFGRPRDDAYIESLLRDLSLWDKRKSRVVELSGGMKRRVMIAKALGARARSTVSR